MNARELSERMAADAEGIAAHLLPNGKRRGREWKAGDVNGGEGGSLSVCLVGAKAGVWKDFATGAGGDLLDLWMASRDVMLPEAIADAKAYLGIRDEMPAGPPKKTYTLPAKPKGQAAKGRGLEWLVGRGLTPETVAAFKVVEQVRGDKIYALFPYLRDGVYVNGKARNIDDKRDMRQEAGAEPCLFGRHLIEPNQRHIVIAEGEIDAMTLHQVGIPAVSVNAGAGNHQWIESDWEWLERFSDIVVAFDNDDAGNKGAAEVIQRLGLDRCRRCVFPGAKDANEFLQAGAGAPDFLEAIDAARPMDPEELRRMSDFINEVKASFYPAHGSHDPRLRFDREFAFFEFRRGEVTLWTGINGHGKSMVLSQVMLGLMAQDERCAIFSGEMSPPRQLKRMVKQATGLDRPTLGYIDAVGTWLHDRCWVFNYLGAARLERLLEVFGYAHQRYGMTHFVIDSLMTLDVPDDGPKANTLQKEAMAKLAAFAKRCNAHVHLVAHPRKGKDESTEPGKLDVAGSGHLTNGADNVFSVWKASKDEAKPTDNSEPDARLVLKKQRNAEGPDAAQNYTLSLWFHKPAMQYRSEPSLRPFSYVTYSNAEAAHVYDE